jgi:hypothetical protein
LIWDNKQSTVSEICSAAAGLTLDCLESGKLLHEGPTLENTFCNRWKPPAFNHYKMNVAFRIGSDNVKAGLGVLVRDSKGVVAAAMCSTLQWRGDVIQLMQGPF